eukprot:TRINITY_DN42163_c0_g1_i1.p1 TRINITY_DN42163_c0_g1~~TRINITY_DN42163_c0_g1_i1.p1  ORF type:complete len:403 (-),score=100.33 TRINITY_DN42163_c0_g1_i1:81-1289(-)
MLGFNVRSGLRRLFNGQQHPVAAKVGRAQRGVRFAGSTVTLLGLGATSMVLSTSPPLRCWGFWGGEKYDVGVLPDRGSSLLRVAPIGEKAVKPSEVDMVLFHGQCPDGFAAAFAAYLKRGDACEYIGISHKQKRLPANVDGKVIAILDFSFDTATMAALMQRAKAVIVIDHHATAQEALKDLPEENKVFEMKMSGATLAWDFFHGDTSKPIPLLFRYIEDKDIWRWTLKRSREFSAVQEVELAPPPAGSVPDPKQAFAAWKRIYDGGNRELDALISRGTSIAAYQDLLVKNQARSAKIRRLKAAPDQKAYVVNASVLPSELGNELAKRGVREGVSYVMVVMYYPDECAGKGQWGVSLRSLFGSDQAAADVSRIAKEFGGGGHRAASGAMLKVTNLEDVFVQE